MQAYLTARARLDNASDKPFPSLPLFARHDKGAGKKIKGITTRTGQNIISQRVAEAIGPEAVGSITPQTFRHYFVTMVLKKTGNLKVAQKLARFANLGMTERYMDLSGYKYELDREYADIFEKSMQQEKNESLPLRIFLCHASDDKPSVRKLYQHLKVDGIDPWLDEEKLLPGQDWEMAIEEAVRNSDIAIVCLSSLSVTKAGFVQKEIRFALDRADEQPEGVIYIIPIRLQECIVPKRLKRFQYVDLFLESGYEKLLESIREQARSLNKNS